VLFCKVRASREGASARALSFLARVFGLGYRISRITPGRGVFGPDTTGIRRLDIRERREEKGKMMEIEVCTAKQFLTFRHGVNSEKWAKKEKRQPFTLEAT